MKINYLMKNILLGIIALVILTIIINLISGLSKYSTWGSVGIMLFLILIFAKIRNRTDKFVSGQIGEQDIDREMEKLSNNFIFLKNGLDTERGNIDKIVIGPTGIWTLEVKSHNGQVTFSGESLLRNGKPFEKNFLSQAYAEAKTLQDLIKSKTGLNFPVSPVVVFSNRGAVVRLGTKKYNGVYVIQKAWLNKLITENGNQSLNENQINSIKLAIQAK
jgi:hypothetical protein